MTTLRSDFDPTLGALTERSEKREEKREENNKRERKEKKRERKKGKEREKAWSQNNTSKMLCSALSSVFEEKRK